MDELLSGKVAVFAADTARAVARAESASIKITGHLWLQWAQIAIEQYQAALHERAVMTAVDRSAPDQSRLFSEALGREMRAAMVAVSATAHAIDAWYGATRLLIPVPAMTRQRWKDKGTPRRSVILETFKVGFALGKSGHDWAAEFDWLFDARDAAVHFDEKIADPVRHPTGTNTAPENVTYSAESAKRAVVLLLGVLHKCQRHPKPHNSELVIYAGRMGDPISRLYDLMVNPGSR